MRDARVTAAVLFAGALFLGALAVPRVLAEAAILPVSPSLEALHRGDLLEPQVETQALDALTRAHRYQPNDARIAVDMALLSLNAVRRDGVAGERGKADLLTAIEELEAGLKLSPANSFAWALLAQARLVRDDGLSESARRALDNSFYMGPFDHGAMLVRSEITLPNWRNLGTEIEPAARREVLALWQRSWEDQKKVIMVACRTRSVAALSDALRVDPAARKEFDQFYEPYLSPEGCKHAP